MKICEYCGTSCQDSARFCPECGARLPAAPAPEPIYAESENAPVIPAPDEPVPVAPAAPVFEPAPEAPAPEQPVWDAAEPAEPVQQQVWDQPACPPSYEPAVDTKKAFLKLPENKKLKKNINAAAIIAYISAALTLVLTLPTGYIDVMTIIAILLTVAAGVMLQAKQSRAAAVVLLAFALINTIYSLIVLGQPAGWLLILAGVYAVTSTFQLEKLWQKYKTERGI